MKLKSVFIRFFKSFNFDSLRKSHQDFKPKPWDSYGADLYPYIRIPIDSEITTIVGANESGKSHLLRAIKKGITGSGFSQRDLCRYSPFFNVERGKECWPHIGLEWNNVTDDEAHKLHDQLTGAPSQFGSFMMFRESPEKLTFYFPKEETFETIEILGQDACEFGREILPQPFEIKSDVALPSSVPLTWLADPETYRAAFASRKFRSTLMNAVADVANGWPASQQEFSTSAPSIFSKLNPHFREDGELRRVEEIEVSETSLQLARSLLVGIANVDPSRLNELSEAIADGEDGYANALVKSINLMLANNLNFPKWWVQDRDFSLRITPREMDLVFTIQDRTGTEYTFGERSSGLKYFLSYLIQSRSRQRSKERAEILLMDEPDAYLSAEAQQDLLKIFDDFARPETDVAPIQVVFVTHSPFLIDKNHADRIRVLEKGKGLVGTRAIRDVSHNHYEPLRSAFGAFVGETAFIGACNLLVEGTADQILLSGAARLTRLSPTSSESETLNLNRLVIVPAGSASQIPYMLYLIRGRDSDKPPVLALLDSDKEGDRVAKLMRKDDPKFRRLIRRDFVLQLGEIEFEKVKKGNVLEIEDLIPVPLAIAAANQFLEELTQYMDSSPCKLKEDDLVSDTSKELQLFDKLNSAAKKRSLHLDKIGFARSVVQQCKNSDNSSVLSDQVDLFLNRMRQLFKVINKKRLEAELDSRKERVGSLVERTVKGFIRDHSDNATKERTLDCLGNIETALDDTIEADAIRVSLNTLKRDFHLDENVHEFVRDYSVFKEKLLSLKDEYALSKIGIEAQN